MKKISNNSLLKKVSVLRIANLTIILAIFLSSSFLVPNSKNITEIDRDFNDITQIPLLADNSPILFEGNEVSLNITDYGNLYKYNQEVSLSSQDPTNVTYFLDDVHDWKSSEINFTIQDIHDTRDWVSDADFLDAGTPFRKYISESNIGDTSPPSHNYTDDLTRDIIHSTINETGAKAMRLHFSRLEIEPDWDYLFIYDGADTLKYMFTGVETDFYTPWFNADTLKLSIDSDVAIQWYGYDIDYYEFYNSSSASYSLFESSWGHNDYGQFTNFALDNFSNNNAIHLSLLGNITRYPDNIFYYASYYENDHVELYQNITVPRGQVIDGYISFDYYAESAIRTNDFFIYYAIDGQIIYNKGFRDIVELGRGTWHDTNKIYMDLWSNTTSLFQNIKSDQNFNISVGIMSGASVTYSGFQDAFYQNFWIDNVSLVLTTLANSTQNGINLTVAGNPLIDDANWGSSSLSLNSQWTLDPISIEFTTTSPSLSFNLNTSIFGYRETTSKIDQQNNDGLNYYILENGTIYWEFYHNFYMPSQYSDNEFIIDKPKNWEILSVLDPTFLPVSYEGGNVGDDYILLNKSSASYPGWWKFIATSPNFIQEENVETSKNNQWGISEFQTGNIGQIKAQINYSSEIPKDLDQTFANLTIYNPEGAIWFKDSAEPLANGTVLFSKFNIAAQNSTGGIHNFTIFWSNGTSVGGFKSNFVITHDSYITLLRPDDAKLDNRTGGSVGDIIPLRIYLRDSENDNPISNAILSFNWTSGPVYMVEIGLGLYDAIIDTSDLGALGLYTIEVSSYKIGFGNSTFNLEINLGEDTVLQRLGSDSSIVINQNSTITFYYYSEVDDEGITGATITVNITNSMYYSVTETTPGTYSILINTVFLDSTGTYQLIFDFSAPGYEPQTHIYQFNIVNPPPPSGSNPYLQLIIIISIAVIAVLGALSIRSYVILPRKRRKEADLLSRTQRFKDIQNIQAIVAIHRDSGIPLYSKSYSILEKHKKELFAGFIQAIITVGQEVAGKRGKEMDSVELGKEDGSRTILELDFKYFYCLICDRQDLRVIFILNERASDRMKKQISDLSLGAMLELSEQIENWDGAIHEFEAMFPPIINKYVELYFKETFKINNAEFIAKLRKENELNSMETRILNVIYSIAKSKKEFYLETIFEVVHEKNQDLIIDGIEGLIKKQVIIPSTK